MSNTKTPLIEGHFYHIYNRGVNGTNLFIEERNYPYFLQLWKKHIVPVAETYAYCLLKNHFHALVRIRDNYGDIPQSPKSKKTPAQQQFSNLFNAYSKSINKAYTRTGRLFEEKYQRIWIDTEDYFFNTVYYIHANLQHHGFTADFKAYPYSSYLGCVSTGKTELERVKLLALFGGKAAFIAFHHRTKTDWEGFDFLEG